MGICHGTCFVLSWQSSISVFILLIINPSIIYGWYLYLSSLLKILFCPGLASSRHKSQGDLDIADEAPYIHTPYQHSWPAPCPPKFVPATLKWKAVIARQTCCQLQQVNGPSTQVSYPTGASVLARGWGPVVMPTTPLNSLFREGDTGLKFAV